MDFIYSQDVFEHVAPSLLPAILKEYRRILKDDGIISFSINYGDHYCSIDKNISPYNFLQYSDKQWKKYNPRLHYVNRLRHADFLQLFKQSGFDIIKETRFCPKNWESLIKHFPFAKHFSDNYTLEELSVTSARIILKKHM